MGAINEIKQKIKDKKFSNDYFKYNTETNEVSLNDEENSLLCKDLLENNEYKLLKTQNKKLLQAINEILEKQPQPSPSVPQWKEVGIISNKNQFITYDFKPNKEYRLSFTWLPHDINNSVIQFLNFYILKENTPFSVLQTFYQEKNADLKLCISNNLIAVLNYNNEKIDNCLYKLEELQE